MNKKVLPLQKYAGLWCILAGVVASLPYIFENAFALCWIGFVLVCIILFKQHSKKRVFTSLFCFFYAYYIVALSFFVSLYPLDFAGLSNFSSLLVVLTALVLIPLVHSLIMTAICFVTYTLCTQKDIGALFPVAFSFAVMLGEYLLSLGPLGFSWARVFVSQIKFLPSLQSASLFGSYFVTFVIVLFCSYFAYGVCTSKRKYISIALAIMMLNVGFGAIRLSQTCEGQTINVAALQGNFSSSEKWSGSVVDESIRRYQTLVNGFENKDVHLVVTPETAFPVTLLNDGDIASIDAKAVDAFANKLSKNIGANVVLGVFTKQDDNEYNSVALYNTHGNIVGTYNKMHLVPFGEVLPYRSVLEVVAPFLTNINMISTDISKGQSFEPVECDFGKVGFLICFDSIFSDSCRKQVRNGAQIVALSTNDSWYKESAALRQHCAHSVIRAIENGVSVVRSANTGISMVISPKGRILSKVDANRQGSAFATVPLLQKTTLYTKIGDVILLVGFSFIVLYAVYKKKK